MNGDDAHPIYQELTQVADDSGHDGEIRWNFEKFLLSPEGEIVGRFDPGTEPEDPKLIADRRRRRRGIGDSRC